MLRFLKIVITALITILFFFNNIFGQTSDGSISTEMLQKIEKSVQKDAYTKAMINAVSNNEIKKLALNRELVGKIDHHFAHKIETAGITNQKSSGRCWLFTALNILRPKVKEKYNLTKFKFSENYLFFWDQLEKANLFLESIIITKEKKIDDREVEWLFKHPISDGGVWNMMVDLVDKYGLVPKEAMHESFNSDNTRNMSRLIRRKLREDGLVLRKWHDEGKKAGFLQNKKTAMLAEVYRILMISLGEPPKEFIWRYVDKDENLNEAKKYTPVSFYKEVVGIDLSKYIMLMNDPSKKYFKLYEIEYDRNMFDGRNWTFINLPIDELKISAKNSILADEGMYFSCDVGKQLNKDEGILAVDMYDYESIFGVSFNMNKKERILSFDSGSSHGMALMGVDTSAAGKPVKWLLENSWGDEKGHNGYLSMTDEWFDEYMFRLVIHKRFIPEKVLKVLTQKPVKLPPWDAMF